MTSDHQSWMSDLEYPRGYAERALVRSRLMRSRRSAEDALPNAQTIAQLAGYNYGPDIEQIVRNVASLGYISEDALSFWQEQHQCPYDWCGDSDCSFCWPNGYECECGDPECSYCWPDGYECECGDIDCSYCYPNGDDFGDPTDDQGDDDGWAGVGEVVAPRGRSRFGIEIEFNSADRHSLIAVLQRNGFGTIDSGYTHDVMRCWKMTTDATVTGGELVSPIMSGSDESIEQVREVIRLIKAEGAETGRNVGLHIHMDATDFRRSQLEAMVVNFRRCEHLLAAYVPAYRYQSGRGATSYSATLIPGPTWDRLEEWITRIDIANRARTREFRHSACPAERYSSINFNSLLTYGSVECRLLGHTLNTIKVRAYVRTLQTIMAASRRRRRAPEEGDGLEWLITHGLEREHADHFRRVVEQRGKPDWLDLSFAA